MTDEEFIKQAGETWDDLILEEFVESTGSGRTDNSISRTLRFVGDSAVPTRTISFEFRGGKLWLADFDNEDDDPKELPDMAAVRAEMEVFVAAFTADCRGEH